MPMNALGVDIWGNANSRFGIGGNSNFSVFGYQHVGIPNAKIIWGMPNANPRQDFALQWNIG